MRDLLFCRFCEPGEVSSRKLQFAVIVATYNGKLVYVKHKKRSTYEVPGGKRNGYSENIDNCAKRELYEETGATKFNLIPLSTYAIRKNIEGSSEYYGRLYYAEINELEELPDTEIGEVVLLDKVPSALTYPHINPHIIERVNEYRVSRKLPIFR